MNGSPLKFICTACGACCKRAGQIPGFPEPVDEKGVCLHLTADHKCSIYETRPTICRVDKLYPSLGVQMGLTRKQFYINNNQICNQWIREDDLGEEYLVDVTQYISMKE